MVVPTWSFETTSARRLIRASPRAASRGGSRRARSGGAGARISGSSRSERERVPARSARGCTGSRSSSPASDARRRGGRQALEREAHQVVVRRGAASGAGRARRRAADAVAQPGVRDVDAAEPRSHARQQRSRSSHSMKKVSSKPPSSSSSSRRTSIAAPCALTVGTVSLLGTSSSRWRPGRYSRSSRPRASVVRAWTSRPRLPVELARVGREERARRRRARRRAARGSGRRARRRCSGAGRTRLPSRRRPRCRGGRARGSRAGARARRATPRPRRCRSGEAPSTTSTSPGGRVCAARLARQSGRRCSPW